MYMTLYIAPIDLAKDHLILTGTNLYPYAQMTILGVFYLSIAFFASFSTLFFESVYAMLGVGVATTLLFLIPLNTMTSVPTHALM